jgi:hypothetical protein
MKRDTLMTILLVIAGIILAFALFGAGVFWKGRIGSSDRHTGRKMSTPRITGALQMGSRACRPPSGCSLLLGSSVSSLV